jgi:WD40 repeat protein
MIVPKEEPPMEIKPFLALPLTLLLMIACQPSGHQPVFTLSTDAAATPLPFPSTPPHTAAKLPGRIRSFDISPDLKTIALATSKGVVLYDFDTPKHLRTLNGAEDVFSIAWSPDGTKLAVGGVDSEFGESGKLNLAIWDASAWKIISGPEISTENPAFQYGALAWSPDGALLATAAYDRGALVLIVQTGEVVSQQEGFLVNPYSISWSPDGSRLIATGDLGYGFRRWRLDTGKAVRLYDQRVDAATQIAWSPDGDRIASVHQNGAVCFWTVKTNECDGFIQAHQTAAFSLVWSPDGSRLATGGGAIRIWDTHTGKSLTAFGEDYGHMYNRLEWPASDGPMVSLETGWETGDTIIRFWDISTGAILVEFRGTKTGE